jgi:hypothetical protein
MYGDVAGGKFDTWVAGEFDFEDLGGHDKSSRPGRCFPSRIGWNAQVKYDAQPRPALYCSTASAQAGVPPSVYVISWVRDTPGTTRSRASRIHSG